MANELATVTAGATSLAKRDERTAARAVLEFQSPTAELIARPIPVTARITIWAIFAMFISFAGVAAIFPVDRVVTANGKLVSRASNIVIQPLETSIVRQINVSEGQIVHKGDLLAMLDPTFSAADKVNYADQVASLQAEVDRMTAEDHDLPYNPTDKDPAVQVQAAVYASRQAEKAYKLENYREKIAGLQATVQRAMHDVDVYTSRLEVAKIVEAKRRELERLQVGSQLNTLSALDSRLEIERGLDEARSTITSATADLQAMIKERDGYIQQRRSEMETQLADSTRKLNDAQGSLDKAALRRKLVEIYAEQDGIVLSVAQISVGSVMQSGDQFITMVPLDAPLEVEVLIPGNESGFVHVDDPATIKFSTFSYSLYGFAKGTVRTISADSFQNPAEDRSKLLKPSLSDDTGLGPVFYRARVSVDEVKLHDLPKSFRLQPGMETSVDIKVGQRTILGYLITRIIPHFGEAMREP
jgi:hemolysin D